MEVNYKQKIESFYEREKRMPSYSEMARLFGFKSKNAVYRLVQKMLDAGLVTKDKLGRLLPTNAFNEIPMAGFVTAGLPAQADELKETVNLESLLVKKKSETYMFEVTGDSMIEAHIADGDMVIAERTNQAKDGDIVIARIDGEFTMKFFRRKGNRAWLEPANKNYKPLYPTLELEIVAIIKAVVRKY